MVFFLGVLYALLVIAVGYGLGYEAGYKQGVSNGFDWGREEPPHVGG
jgi:hypothetical protein